jgi:ankyrin repeat protein
MKRLSINFNAGDLKSGRTPIHHAVENNDAGLIEYLICECHADINAKCFSDQTPLSLAIDKSFDEIANLLKSLGASDETLN